MHAVIRSGGKQFRVQKGDVVRLPLLTGEAGSEIELGEVLHVSSDDKQSTGNPLVDGAKVKGTILRHGKDKKILVYTYKRRKGFEKRQGHRQDFTEVRIDDVTL